MRVINRITDVLNHTGNLLVLALMVMVTADVTMRKVLTKPFLGVFEVSGFALGAIIWFGFAYTFREKGHVRMDLLFERLSPRSQLAIEVFSSLLALGLMALILWQSILAALLAYRINEISTILRLPIGIVRMIVPLGALVVCLQLLGEVFRDIAQLLRGTKAPS
ncbi:MAG: TRAP transporter small permease [Chloroflexi bacterium]|nr:TRAP transporter small permease [Chloroflexota bacterium]